MHIQELLTRFQNNNNAFEVLPHILNNLNITELKTCRLVCQKWNDFASKAIKKEKTHFKAEVIPTDQDDLSKLEKIEVKESNENSLDEKPNSEKTTFPARKMTQKIIPFKRNISPYLDQTRRFLRRQHPNLIVYKYNPNLPTS